MPDDAPMATESIGSVEMRPLDGARLRAIRRGRTTIRRFVTISLVMIAVGVLIMLGIEYSAFHPGSRPWGALIIAPAVLELIWVLTFLSNRRNASKDLRSGTYACYSGPLRLQRYVASDRKQDDQHYTKVVLGSFKEIQIEGDTLTFLEQHLPAEGQADVAVHLEDLLEIGDDIGATVYASPGLIAARSA